MDDETLATFIKNKAPKKERKRNKGQGPKSRQTNRQVTRRKGNH
jgi:hypothetical protein